MRAVREAVFVAMAGNVLELLLGQLKALGLSLASLYQRLLSGVIGVMRHPAANLAGLGSRSLGLLID